MSRGDDTEVLMEVRGCDRERRGICRLGGVRDEEVEEASW